MTPVKLHNPDPVQGSASAAAMLAGRIFYKELRPFMAVGPGDRFSLETAPGMPLVLDAPQPKALCTPL